MYKIPKFLKRPEFLKIPTFNIPLLTKKHSEVAGLPPGTPVYIGQERTEPVKINLMSYNRDNLQEKEITDIRECLDCITLPESTWINVTGIHDSDKMTGVAGTFDIHPLIIEDIVNTQQRPKLEEYDDSLFIVLKMLDFNEEDRSITSEQISMVLNKGYLITFQEREGDIFDIIRSRIRSGKGRIRSMGNDYLAYSLVDAIVDNYFVILEKIGESIEAIEEELMDYPNPKTLQQIYFLKREMIHLRKSTWPLRELTSNLERSESELIATETQRYVRDLYDHTIQVIDMVETYRDMLSGMLDLYLSSISNKMNEVSNKMNEVMKVLTIIATIFIPLTFIAGIYGMNFTNMPELSWEYGYPMAWMAMLVIAVIMVVYFKRKKWL